MICAADTAVLRARLFPAVVDDIPGTVGPLRTVDAIAKFGVA